MHPTEQPSAGSFSRTTLHAARKTNKAEHAVIQAPNGTASSKEIQSGRIRTVWRYRYFVYLSLI